MVPADPADREAGLAGAAGLRGQPRAAADRSASSGGCVLNNNGADLTLSGAFLAGLLAGPYAGAIVGVMLGIPPLFAGEWGALPFAIGCGFAGGGLRELCPQEAIWHFSPLFFTGLHRHVWRLVRRFEIDWVVILLAAPIGLAIIQQAVGYRVAGAAVRHPGAHAGMWFAVLVCTVLSVAIPIKIWNSARIEHRLQEQEKLLMASRLDALASQINPHFLFNTLTSISSLTRSQPENGAHADREAVGAAPPAAAQPGPLRHAARGARSDRRVPRHREHPLRAAAARSRSTSTRPRST